MKIQLNTDINIDATQGLAQHVNTTLEHALERFANHVTRVEVHLSDENAGKNGQNDQRCMLEARLERRLPVAVTEHAATMHQAVQGATHKLVRLLDSTLGRLHDHRAKVSGAAFSEAGPLAAEEISGLLEPADGFRSGKSD